MGAVAVTGELPAQMTSNAENVSIWWRHNAEPAELWKDTTHCLISSLEIELDVLFRQKYNLYPWRCNRNRCALC